MYYNSKPAKPAEPSVAGKTGGGAVEAVGAVGGVGGFGGVIGPIFNPDQSPDETDGGWEVVETWNGTVLPGDRCVTRFGGAVFFSL